MAMLNPVSLDVFHLVFLSLWVGYFDRKPNGINGIARFDLVEQAPVEASVRRSFFKEVVNTLVKAECFFCFSHYQ